MFLLSWLTRQPAADTDAAEVARARDGDESAFEALVSRHERTVWRVCRRMLGDPDAATDATQDAFLRVYRALGRFRGEATFRTWVIGIAINVCRNHLGSAAARLGRHSVPLDDSPAGGESRPLPLPDPAPGPEALARASEVREALERAMKRLAPEHREVIVLAEIQGMPHETIAAAIGVRAGTVKSRLSRARA
ncbi:MAG: RNA polymerase sigma factor, partial [Acidobacteriota bacterium]